MSLEKKILKESVAYDKDFWENATTPEFDFRRLCIGARAPEKWAGFRGVSSGEYGDSILKPLSYYAQVLIPRPKLVSIEGNLIKLRFYTFADIYLQDREGELYNVDRPWIRQYYNVREDEVNVGDSWPKTYAFYTPWFLDDNIEVSYSQVEDEESAFLIHPKTDAWQPVSKGAEFAFPHMVRFNFKKNVGYMKDTGYTVIECPHPMFDMTFTTSDIIVEKIRKFYAKD
jgi:hypothetical protein